MTVVIIVDDEHEGVVAVPRIGGEWVADKQHMTDAGPWSKATFCYIPCQFAVSHSPALGFTIKLIIFIWSQRLMVVLMVVGGK